MATCPTVSHPSSRRSTSTSSAASEPPVALLAVRPCTPPCGERRRDATRASLPGFAEGPIRFPPTFKFDKQRQTYDMSAKRRVQSWTDRVLYTPRPPKDRARGKPPTLDLLKYRHIPTARHSDHRPVVATFKVARL